jgi:hypothetical protein
LDNNSSKDIFYRSAEIIINSAKTLILDEWDGVVYKFSPDENVDDLQFEEFTSEFMIDANDDGKIYLSAGRNVIQYLALKLYGIDLSMEEDQDMFQDSINELLNYFIGNAARQLETLGLDFIESLIPTPAHFEEYRKSFKNYMIIIPLPEGNVIFTLSLKI